MKLLIKKKKFSRNRVFNNKTVTDYRAPIPKRKLYTPPSFAPLAENVPLLFVSMA
jgi:hypothetical protein